VAQVLKSAGYTTGGFGKWGLGDIGTPGVPWKHGFDQFFGYLHQIHAHFYYPPYLWDNDKKFPLTGNDNGKRTNYSHDVIASRAREFIRSRHGQPFFCYVPFTIPHMEYLVPQDSIDEYKGKIPELAPIPPGHYAAQEYPRAAYAGMVSRMDRDVGRIMDLLKELKLDENTIAFFASDNGPIFPAGQSNFFNSAGPLRGRKQTMYEGGIRIPMIARWPGRISAGAVSDLPWTSPTFCRRRLNSPGLRRHPDSTACPWFRRCWGRRSRATSNCDTSSCTGSFRRTSPRRADSAMGLRCRPCAWANGKLSVRRQARHWNFTTFGRISAKPRTSRRRIRR
jgi:arylsulfatase A-like enzyme